MDFTYEIIHCDPQQHALIAVYRAEGKQPVEINISMAMDDIWDDETIAIRANATMGRVLKIWSEQEAIAKRKETATDCAHLVGKVVSDTYDPHKALTDRPNIPDFHPIYQNIRKVGVSKLASEQQFEVVDRDPDDAQRQLTAFRRDYGCSPAQIRVQLHKMDRLGDVDEAMKQADRETEIEWLFANSIKRTGKASAAIQNLLGLSDEETDDLWIAAQKETVDKGIGRP